MAAANNTPVPMGLTSTKASPPWSGPLGQGLPGQLPFTVRARVRGPGPGAMPPPVRSSKVWPPINLPPIGSRTERTPAKVWARSSCWIAAGPWGTVTRAWALSTWAPDAQRSLQAWRVVRRALSQASPTRAGKPSTLCSRVSPLAPRPTTAASSAGPPRPACARAAARGAAASLAPQPWQAMAVPLSIALPLPMAWSPVKPSMKR